MRHALSLPSFALALAGTAIAQDTHWAFRRPALPPAPRIDDGSWARGPIDSFTLARMQAHGLTPQPEAGRETLIRRVTLALTGLPPALDEIDDFVADRSPDAYEKVVDRLLRSAAYGEHQARRWLDLARYADTNGYEKDKPRQNWLWRDWLIDAFRRDLPFDRFTIDQLAGDLVPNATIEQRVATGFHRNSMLNDEGGIDAEEFRVVAVKDRVDATARIWLGLTMDCAQCHDHKYDPITTREYYEFYAFFDQTADTGVGEAPTLAVPLPERRDEYVRLQTELADLERRYDRDDPKLTDSFETWLAGARRDVAERTARAPRADTWQHLGPIEMKDPASAYAREFPPERGVRYEQRVYGKRWQAQPDWRDGAVHAFEPVKGVHFLHRVIDASRAEAVTLSLGSDDGIEVWLNGAELLSREVDRAAAPDQEQVRASLRAGRNELLLKVVNTGGPGGFFFRIRNGDEPDAVFDLLAREDGVYTAVERARLAAHFRSVTPLLARIREQLDTRRRQLAGIPTQTTMVLEQRAEPRDTKVLHRGDFRQPRDTVTQSVPAALHPFPGDAPRSRLGFAQWLVDDDNPLLGRVVMNRIWAEHLGRGLVTTPEDFGARGDRPSHPQLLDWLARTFVDGGYSVAAMHRRIVTSATFRQSSHTSTESLMRDPDNVWLARFPRQRLTFEGIRDVSLAVAGLLDPSVGGPSIMPPQPPGIWENSFGFYDLTERWKDDETRARYRRGMYVFLRRTAMYPTFQIFDGPPRDVCAVKRSRTNTPLQALATLNDPAFVEAAGSLAQRILSNGNVTADRDRIEFAVRLCTARPPTATEQHRLVALLRDARRRFESVPREADALCRAARVRTDEFETAQLAAWTVVANVLLNLDETLTNG